MYSKYAREGFLNLPKDVVMAMKGAGFKWGGDWETHKDLMHFDMPKGRAKTKVAQST